MSTPLRIVLYALVGACLVIAATRQSAASPNRPGGDGGAQYRLDRADADRAGAGLLSSEQRARTFTFAPGTSPDEQRLFLGAVASARPEARRLVDLVDGLVTVHFERPARIDAIGLTSFDGEDYEVRIDLAAVISRFGVREAEAIVLHELGHVVDLALVPDDLVSQLDRDIPIGESCQRDGPTVGACAPIEERFADTFSKWAMDDLGVNLASGYRILPPVPLEQWGRPLTRL
ncbi:MAG: hypothetical protein ACRDLS_02455 [Solirubrobacteraceae bacterium]